jgi:sialate O-acetylesterase
MPALAAEPLLNPVFQDHAVLQRDTPVHIWGSAAPGATITVSVSDKSAEARADGSGHWSAVLPAMPAGGPYALLAQSDAGQRQTVSDILLGDDYLCSGQSNMVLAVSATVDSGAEIQIAANDTIRLMTVANVTSTSPLASVTSPIKWEAASPATVPGFSAACYYFGRELQKSVHVPLGLIQSAWSGANITSFMSTAAIRKAGGQEDRLDALALYASDPAAGMKRWGELVEAWWRLHLGSEPWKNPAVSSNWPEAPQSLGYWSEWGVPALAHFSGNMWYRTSVTLTTAQAAQEAQLALGGMNSEDQAWVDGRFVGATFGYNTPRIYALPVGALRAGTNDILVNVNCGWRGCGMIGPAASQMLRLKDGSTIAISGPWRYQPVPGSVGDPPHVPWGATAGLAMAYNAMIAPLAPYGLRGVVWYQGESNSGDPDAYRGLLKAMMADWRGLFGAPLPFLIVQLPDWGLPPLAPEDSSWARLRESQRAVVASDPNTALTVTIDIGDHMGLHPANKQEVGRRLSLAARRLIYGESGVMTGPVPVRATRNRSTVSVEFTGFEKKLVAVNAVQPIGFELCAGASCRFVPAAIRGNSVRLTVPRGLNPTHVRYCWADGPVCTLYDAARMPAVPFDLTLRSRAQR